MRHGSSNVYTYSGDVDKISAANGWYLEPIVWLVEIQADNYTRFTMVIRNTPERKCPFIKHARESEKIKKKKKKNKQILSYFFLGIDIKLLIDIFTVWFVSVV